MLKVKAIFKNGVFKPEKKITLPDGEIVEIEIYCENVSNIGNQEYLKIAEKSLSADWNNPELDVYSVDDCEVKFI